MPKSKENHRYFLSAVFPWFDGQLAETLTRKLTDDELSNLRRQLQEAEAAIHKEVAKQARGT